jgi:hypothetical protein
VGLPCHSKVRVVDRVVENNFRGGLGLMDSVLIVGTVIGVTAVRFVIAWVLPTAAAGGLELWRSPVMVVFVQCCRELGVLGVIKYFVL